MKFAFTQAVSDAGIKLLPVDADIYVANSTDPCSFLKEMSDTDALCIRIGKCDRHAIEQSPMLKVIGRTGVGFDTVDIEAANERGIPVVITPGANNRSVAEHALAMIFALSKNLVEANNELRDGRWEIREANKAFELEGKTAGILGFGAVGRETCRLCKAVGMKTAAYDPFIPKERIEEAGVSFYDDYEKLISECDVVSVHLPLTVSTKGMIAEEQLASMKKSALLINTSRGGIVDEEDLAVALKNGVIAGAGIDVFGKEPPSGNPLMSCPNIIVSPHAAARTHEAVRRMESMCLNGCLAVCSGYKWPYVADKSVYEHEIWKNAEWAEA